MTTSVHGRSISVRVFVVWFRYMRVPFRYIIKSISVHCKLSFIMLKVCKCWMDVWSVMLNFLCATERFFTVDIKHWSPPADQTVNQYQQKSNKHVTSDVQVYVTEASWNPKGRRAPASSHCTLRMSELWLYCEITLEKRYLKSRRRYGQLSRPQSTSPRMIEADGPLPLAGVNDAFEPPRLVT